MRIPNTMGDSSQVVAAIPGIASSVGQITGSLMQLFGLGPKPAAAPAPTPIPWVPILGIGAGTLIVVALIMHKK